MKNVNRIIKFRKQDDHRYSLEHYIGMAPESNEKPKKRPKPSMQLSPIANHKKLIKPVNKNEALNFSHLISPEQKISKLNKSTMGHLQEEDYTLTDNDEFVLSSIKKKPEKVKISGPKTFEEISIIENYRDPVLNDLKKGEPTMTIDEMQLQRYFRFNIKAMQQILGIMPEEERNLYRLGQNEKKVVLHKKQSQNLNAHALETKIQPECIHVDGDQMSEIEEVESKSSFQRLQSQFHFFPSENQFRYQKIINQNYYDVDVDSSKQENQNECYEENQFESSEECNQEPQYEVEFFKGLHYANELPNGFQVSNEQNFMNFGNQSMDSEEDHSYSFGQGRQYNHFGGMQANQFHETNFFSEKKPHYQEFDQNYGQRVQVFRGTQPHQLSGSEGGYQEISKRQKKEGNERMIMEKMKSCLSRHTVEQVQIRWKGLPRFKAVPPLIYPTTKSILIDKNDIESIDRLSRGQYPLLEQISINFNNLTYVPRLRACHLKKLRLGSNKIVDITAFALGNYPELTELFLASNQIVILPRINAPKLSIIDVNKNAIEDLKEFFSGTYDRLIEIQAQSNKLTFIPEMRTPNIRRIHFQNNQIETIEQCFQGKNFAHLVTINFFNNKLTKISSINVPSLKMMILKSNKLSELNVFAQRQFNQTCQFHISGNSIKHLPKLNMGMLQSLYAEESQIESIEGFCQGRYLNLSRIYFENNKLRKIPVIDAPALSLISLKQNQIEDVDMFFGQVYENLQSVNLSQNFLTHLPKLSSLNIKELSLASNPLKSISPEFFDCSYEKLKYFNISFDEDQTVKELDSKMIELLARTFPAKCSFSVCYDITTKDQHGDLQKKIDQIQLSDKIQFAYHIKGRLQHIQKNQKYLESKRLNQQRKQKIYRWGTLTILFIFIIALILYSQFTTPKLKLKKISK